MVTNPEAASAQPAVAKGRACEPAGGMAPGQHRAGPHRAAHRVAERIISVLRERIGDCDIESLPIALTAVATDLDTGKEARLRSGRLFDAIRADRCRKGIRTFCESVRPPQKKEAPSRGLLDIAFAAMQSMHDTIAELKLPACSPGVIIKGPRNACGFFEFGRANEPIALGRARAANAFSKAMP